MDRPVLEIATTSGILVTYPQESMGEALRRLSARGVGRLPVLKNRNEHKLVGVLRRSDVIRAYDRAITNRAHHQHHVETLRLNKLNEAGFYHLQISETSEMIGKSLSEVKLPDACLVVSVRRGRKLLVAHGNTNLRGNDQLTVFANQDCIPKVRQILGAK
ncbi:MAG: CBS domain-containing protein [Anaerolineae bacterium]|nr:CBS domain-containing protein [Anaerolineae bacterium]